MSDSMHTCGVIDEPVLTHTTLTLTLEIYVSQLGSETQVLFVSVYVMMFTMVGMRSRC